jgi:acetoin utilization deacetylase AcuC-like enzyme
MLTHLSSWCIASVTPGACLYEPEMQKTSTNEPVTGLIYNPVYMDHRPGAGHPESPMRCEAAMKGIAAAVPENALSRLKPRAATEDEVALCHTPDYIRIARRDIISGFGGLSTGDTDVSKESFDVALMAVGGVLAAVDAVMAGTVRNAFCVVRPPGHHATTDRGMGFCVFNNAAIAARYAQKKHGISRALVVDWDVHHGNGTQDIFYDDPSVFYFSTHQWPCYPGTGATHETGAGKAKGTKLNCPVPPGSGRKEILGAFKEKLVPAMKAFKPEFVIISAGFDARKGDPIGNLELTDDDFADLTDIGMKIAADYAGGRLVSVLEGGYNLSGLASACGVHVKHLI